MSFLIKYSKLFLYSKHQLRTLSNLSYIKLLLSGVQKYQLKVNICWRHHHNYLYSIHPIILNENRTKNFMKISSRFFQLDKDESDLDDSKGDDDHYIDLSIEFQDRGIHNIVCRNIYRDSQKSHLIKELEEVESIDEAFEILSSNNDSLTLRDSCQAIVCLCSLRTKIKQFSQEKIIAGEYLEFAAFDESICSNPQFKLILNVIERSVNSLETEDLAGVMMSLNEFGYGLDNELMRALHVEVLKSMGKFDLQCLVQLSFIFRGPGVGPCFTQAKLLEQFQIIINNSKSINDVALISIFLLNARKLVSKRGEILQTYKSLIKTHLEDSSMHSADSYIIVLVAKCCNILFSRLIDIEFSRNIILTLRGKIDTLSTLEVISLNASLRKGFEPREIYYKIREKALRLFIDCKNVSLQMNLIQCIVPDTSFESKAYYESLITKNISVNSITEHAANLFRILRFLRTPDESVCHKFWNTLFENMMIDLGKITDEDSHLKREWVMGQFYRRYITIKDVWGHFRSPYLENEMRILLKQELFHGAARFRPAKVSRMISFLLAFSNDEVISPMVYDAVERNAYQFGVYDINAISKGVDYCISNKKSLRENLNTVSQICNILDRCTEAYIPKLNSLFDLTILTQAYLTRHHTPCTSLFDALMKRHLDFLGDLNSRSIGFITLNMIHSRYYSEELFESIIDYIIKNKDYILPNVIHRSLYCLSLCGCCQLKPEFLDACQNILESTCQHQPPHKILQSSLSMCSHKSVSSKLIHHIFNIKFMDQLDDEIAASDSMRYPLLVRTSLMNLNRAICIDCPEEKIPWFHETYCRDQCQTEYFEMTELHKDVYDTLSKILGSHNMVAVNKKSPYYYNLDFEFVLDRNGKPCNPGYSIPKNDAENYKRVCILLRDDESYCSNRRVLNGMKQLERQHLEILGYVVVELPHYQWQSMNVKSINDKVKLLRSLIYKELLVTRK